MPETPKQENNVFAIIRKKSAEEFGQQINWTVSTLQMRSVFLKNRKISHILAEIPVYLLLIVIHSFLFRSKQTQFPLMRPW